MKKVTAIFLSALLALSLAACGNRSQGTGTGIQTDTTFLSYRSALEYVFQLAEKERLILAIDEYPYVARSSKSLASTLQFLIGQYKDRSKLMLILCGSSMSYMGDHVLAYKASLYGRRTAQMKITHVFGVSQGEKSSCKQACVGFPTF